MTKSLILHSFVTVYLAISAKAAKSCFYPDGSTVSTAHTPCNTTVTNSACCDPIDACTTSGLCLGRTGSPYRGSCTDASWTDPACPSKCTLDPSNKLPYSDFTILWSCDPPGGPFHKYCCNSAGHNCCTIATFDFGTTGSAFKGGMDQLFLDAATGNSSVAAPVTVTVTASASGSTAEAASSTAALTAASVHSSSSSSNLGPIIGAAVGAPLGVLALGLLGFLLWRWRKNSENKSAHPPIEMDPAKPYYNHDTSAYPQQTSAEAPAWTGNTISRSTTRTGDPKSPGWRGGPLGVHEMI